MEHLFRIAATKRQPGSDPQSAGLNLFREDGSFEPLQADLASVREALAIADGNMLWIDAASSPSTAALVLGWPWPWRSGTLLLDAVGADDRVCLHRRVRRPLLADDGGSASYLEGWIRVVGPARMASLPLFAVVSAHAAEVTAGDVILPPGCQLASLPEQVLGRMERDQEVESHA